LAVLLGAKESDLSARPKSEHYESTPLESNRKEGEKGEDAPNHDSNSAIPMVPEFDLSSLSESYNTVTRDKRKREDDSEKDISLNKKVDEVLAKVESLTKAYEMLAAREMATITELPQQSPKRRRWPGFLGWFFG